MWFAIYVKQLWKFLATTVMFLCTSGSLIVALLLKNQISTIMVLFNNRYKRQWREAGERTIR